MTKLLERAGASFLRAFGIGVVAFLPGIWLAPDLKTAYALAIAATGASIAAGLRAFQVFVPQFSWGSIFSQPLAAYADSFTRAAVGFAVVGLADWFTQWDPSNWRAVATSVFLGALAAGSRAVQGLLTPGETPAKDFPPVKPA